MRRAIGALHPVSMRRALTASVLLVLALAPRAEEPPARAPGGGDAASDAAGARTAPQRSAAAVLPGIRQAVLVLQDSRSRSDVLRAMQTLDAAAEKYDGREAIARFRRGEAVLAVASAMMDFSGHPEILASACSFISSMGMRNDARAALARAAAVELIVSALNTHSDHLGVLEQCCGAFINLAIDGETSRRIAAAGGIRAVMQAMAFATVGDREPERAPGEGMHPSVFNMALAALANLAVCVDEHASYLIIIVII
jgi:hypothetical protein